MNRRFSGILLTFALAMVFLLVFFGKIIRDPNHVLFSNTGDGMKTYYFALFYVQNDTVNVMSSGMNYPFGELYIYTDAQLPVVVAIQFISRHIWDIRDYTVAIINLLMLLSVAAGAIFLYFILMETGIAWWYASLVSVGIAFLSPQIGRLGGHFSLAWVLWIPLMIWLIMQFDNRRSWVLSIAMGLITWIAGLMHFYFLGFFGFLIGGYWLYRFYFYKKTLTHWYRDLLHFFMQYLLPVLLLQLFVFIHDGVTDRPGYPFGFQTSLAHPVGVFFPSGTPWAFVPKILTVFKHIPWESFSYIGTVALAGCFTGLILIIIHIFRKKAIGKISNHILLNLFFWIALVALLFSFGVPFIFGLQHFTDQIGIIRQIRVLARFSWLFYYVVNMVVFAALFRYAFRAGMQLKWKITAILALCLLWTEAAFNVHGIAPYLNNRFPEMEGVNKHQNNGLNEFKSSEFQAIIPMPYFHIGSENLWIDGSNESKKNTLLFSLQTGLPTTGVILSRTSISQSFMQDALLKEPLQRLEIMDYLTDDRPFLILKMNDYIPTDAEIRILKEASGIKKTPEFTLYTLPVTSLKSMHEVLRREVIAQFDTLKLLPKNGFFISDSLRFVHLFSFDDIPSKPSLRGDGAFHFPEGEWKACITDTLHGMGTGKKITIGFWMYNYLKDGFARSQLRISHRKPGNNQLFRIETTDFFKHIKAYQGDWALIELDSEIPFEDDIIELEVRNNVIPAPSFVVDELLIREKGIDVWQTGDKFLILNGRKFLRR
jgi:hypothetical protein